MDAKEANVDLPYICSSVMHPENYAVFVGDDYYEYNSCCAFDARADAIYEHIDKTRGMSIMEVQDWYNENVPKEELIYAGAMTAQFIWVRDSLAGMIYYNCKDINPDFTDWELRKQYLTVESTHTSKSCLLPVYKFTIGDKTLQVRGNFHDWCVMISNIKMTIDQFPDWMQDHFQYGYYEGMTRDENNLEFCVGDKERLYAILWWMFNEGNI